MHLEHNLQSALALQQPVLGVSSFLEEVQRFWPDLLHFPADEGVLDTPQGCLVILAVFLLQQLHVQAAIRAQLWMVTLNAMEKTTQRLRSVPASQA